MPSAIIANNIIDNADVTVVSQSTISGSAFTRAIDGRLTTNAGFASGATRIVVIDLGSERSFNAVGLARHNFAAVGCTLEIYTGTSTTSSTTTLLATIEPDTDYVIWEDVGAQITDRYLYLYFSGHSSAAYLGDIVIGTVLSFGTGQPVGFVDPVLASNDEIIGNVTRGGFVAGTTYRPRPKRFSISIRNQTATWFEENWPTVLGALRRGPFYFRWADTDDGFSTAKRPAYCWVRKEIDSPQYSSQRHCSVSIEVEGITE